MKEFLIIACSFMLCSTVIANSADNSSISNSTNAPVISNNTGNLSSFNSANSSAISNSTDNTEKEKLGVFFYTCDLGASEATAQHSDKSLAGRPNSFIVVDKGDSNRHSQLRHCFVMLGSEAKGILKNKLVVEIADSLGYYNTRSNKGGVISEDRWLLNIDERKKYVISCTPIVQVGMVGINKLNLNAEITEQDVEDVWGKIGNEMRIDSKNNIFYDKDTHNCCTVSFNALRKVRDGDKNFIIDLSHIKKRNFNIFGRGISFDFEDDSIFGYAEGSGKLIYDGISIFPKIVVRKIDSDYVEAEHDRDKEEL